MVAHTSTYEGEWKERKRGIYVDAENNTWKGTWNKDALVDYGKK